MAAVTNATRSTQGDSTTNAPMSDAEYVAANGNSCPHCRSDEVSGSSGLEVDGTFATQEMGCDACGESWIDRYRLSGWIPA